MTIGRIPPIGLLLVPMGLLGCFGCFGNETTDFPPGLEPADENTAPLPTPTASEPFPEVLETVHGTKDGVMFSHSYGYIHASPEMVWAAMKTADVVADRRNTDRHTATLGVEPEYDHSFLLEYAVDDLVTVEWQENWRYGALEGETLRPTRAVVAFRKTFGTTFIRLLEGSMSLEEVEDGIVLVGLVERLDAAMTESEKPAGYQADVFASLLALSRGQPLPPL